MNASPDPADREPVADARGHEGAPRPSITAFGFITAFAAWLERLDPGTHRRIKGLRLVTAYGLAAALGTLQDVTHGLPRNVSVGLLAAGFALWASVSEARTTRPESSRDLALLCASAAFGAAIYVCLARPLLALGHAGPELVLVTGAFCVGYLKRFGLTGAGLGSQFYIGQLMAYSAGLIFGDLPAIAIAALIAMLGSIVPRLLSGPAERPAIVAALGAGPPPGHRRLSPEFVMGLQAATGALIVVALNAWLGIEESAWAITACVYVVAGSATGTVQRVRRRIIGTLVGVPVGLVCLPIAEHAPLMIWLAAALAMIVYSMALPERYDIACGAFAFTLIVTLAASGVHSVSLLAARAWETLIGGALGMLAAMVIFPLRQRDG
jgi:Fusaric acid resistance protein-like